MPSVTETVALWDFDGTLAFRNGMRRGCLVEALAEIAPGHGVVGADLAPGPPPSPRSVCARFAAVVNSSLVGWEKPNRRIFEEALARAERPERVRVDFMWTPTTERGLPEISPEGL
jgi:hypothetical protein